MGQASKERVVRLFHHNFDAVETEVRERYLDALHWTVDGNFQLSQRKKRMDPDDFALTEGAGYFANAREYAEFVRKLPPTGKDIEVSTFAAYLRTTLMTRPRKRSTCNRFGAMGYGSHLGKVSGTMGLSCSRHMFALGGGGVDLEGGERYGNTLLPPRRIY